MNVHVRQWGNSAAIRLPQTVLSAAGLRIDDAVSVREESGRLVIEPIRAEPTIDELIAAITPDNFHEEIDFGPAQGNEVW